MDPFTISMAVAPLILSSAKLSMLICALKDSYTNAPTTLIATWTECKMMHITLSRIQGLVYKNESALSLRLTAHESMREAFDGALTGCRMTLAALNLELDKLVEPKTATGEGVETMKIGLQVKQNFVWKENIMKQLLDQTRGQMSSLQCLIQLLESEAQTDILKLLKQSAADIRRIYHLAKSIRSDQGIDDDQSSFHLAHQYIAYGLVPSYEAQLSQSSTYQRAQTAAGEEFLARKIELLDEKYALEEKLEGLRLEMDLKDEKATQQEHDILSKTEEIGKLQLDILQKDERLLRKEKLITKLKNRVMPRDKAKNLKHDSIIHWVARNGYVKAVDQLLMEGANIDAIISKGYTPLHEAAIHGHAKAAKALLQKGANKEAASKDGLAPLHAAAHFGHVEVVKVLLEKGANKDAASLRGSTAVHLAAEEGHVAVMKVLLEQGANKEAADMDGRTALHKAANSGHVEIVKILLENGANKEAADMDGRTALHKAAISGQAEIVKMLLENGANKEASSKVELTQLHAAAQFGHVEV
ncbi:hypothetical protein MMC31_003396 [Peltigera leucophlebia]|nr:hypothetical protein [Peltigera leucophlebia]